MIRRTTNTDKANRFHQPTIGGSLLRTLLIHGLVMVGVAAFVLPVAAHDGSNHAGTPHWVFLLLILIGGLIIALSGLLDRDIWGNHPRRVLTGVLFGLAVALLGTIAVIQIQVEPIGTTPTVHEWYPVLASSVATFHVTGSILLGIWKWLTRPEYGVLGVVLGLWVGYPALMPNNGYQHPLGYLLVIIMPCVLGYIVWHDIWPVIQSKGIDRLSRRVGLIVATMYGIFFLFSTGLFTVNPEQGVNSPSRAFVTTAEFANPLVVWPAVEFYLPSIPLAGAMSIGTAILILILVGLIGLDAMLLTAVW